MKEHQKKLKELNYDENKEKEINKEYDQKILDIYLKSSNYQYNYILGEYLRKNSITSAKEFMENKCLTGDLKNENIIKIKKLDLERKNKLGQLN